MADRLIVPEPYLYVELNNTDITTHITPFLISFRYIDNDGLQKQESDDIEIELHDPDGFFRENPPARGSALKVKFGYTDKIRNAGVFFIDSYTYSISRDGDIFTIKALAKDVKSSYRTIKTTAFENKTLKQIAEEIAKRHGYKLHFRGEDVAFTRLTQNQKRDLKFLAELCKLYGKTCKVSNKTLVIIDPEEPAGIYKLTREHIISASFEVSSLYEQSSKVVYFDPSKKETTQDKKQSKVKASGDTQKINKRVENKRQAEMIAKKQAMLNTLKDPQAKIECIGIPDLHAGGWVAIEGFGRFDREYYIQTATHVITRDGYTTELELLLAPSQGGKKK